MFENAIPHCISLGRILPVCFLIILGAHITAPAQGPVYELRADNVIYKMPGTACTTTSTTINCPEWQPIDKPQDIKMIAAGQGSLIYQLRNDGTIWRSRGALLVTALRAAGNFLTRT